VAAASAASAGCVAAASAASVAGVVALLAASSLDPLAVSPAAGVPGPASAGGPADPGSVSRRAVLAVVGIADPDPGFLCWEVRRVRRAAGPSDEQRYWGEESRQPVARRGSQTSAAERCCGQSR